MLRRRRCLDAIGLTSTLPFLADRANEPRPLPNLGAEMRVVLPEQPHGEAASFLVRREIHLMGALQHVFGVAEINPVGPDRSGGGNAIGRSLLFSRERALSLRR